jgi:PAS domain-containing protein
LKRVCAWCGNQISPDENGDGLVSHGICLGCSDQFLPHVAVSLQTIIDPLPIPILVVDGDVMVSSLNRKAQEVLGVSSEQAENQRGGELFDCIHAHHPGGCGRSLHCSGCALRRAITTTYETGAPQAFVPASLHTHDPSRPSPVALTITTVKREDFVLVRLDKVE